MFLDFLKNGKLNKKVLIAENYKTLGLNEQQYTIISLVLEFDKIDKRISSPIQLAKYMTISVERIENELNDLINKGMLKIDVTSKTHNLDFSPLYDKLAMVFQVNIINEMSKSSPQDFVEHYFGVKLSNAQLNVLKEFGELKNAPTVLLDLLIGQKFKNVEEFIIYIKNINSEEEIDITEYDWLRNS